jgi:hypothetical protein
MSPKEVMGDIHQKAGKRLKKDVRAMLFHCANVGRAGASVASGDSPPALREVVIRMPDIRQLRERAEQMLNQTRELRDRL